MTDPTLDWLRSEMQDVRERVEKATEGPWNWEPYRTDSDTRYQHVMAVHHTNPDCGDGICDTYHSDPQYVVEVGQTVKQRHGRSEDADFIAHARTDLPAALSVLDRIGTDLARADMDTLFDALDRLEDACGPEVVEVLGELRDVALRREEA